MGKGRRDASKLKLISVEELCGDDFFLGWLEGDYSERASQLTNLEIGMGLVAESRPNVDSNFYQNTLEKYKKAGLDVGKGDAEFGYRMPNENGNLKLIIFRRR